MPAAARIAVSTTGCRARRGSKRRYHPYRLSFEWRREAEACSRPPSSAAFSSASRAVCSRAIRVISRAMSARAQRKIAAPPAKTTHSEFSFSIAHGIATPPSGEQLIVVWLVPIRSRLSKREVISIGESTETSQALRVSCVISGISRNILSLHIYFGSCAIRFAIAHFACYNGQLGSGAEERQRARQAIAGCGNRRG